MATFVVIPGAGDVASNWDLVAAELRERGHRDHLVVVAHGVYLSRPAKLAECLVSFAAGG